MYVTLENILLIGSSLLILSVFFSKSSKYGIPTVVLFILVGMLAGADGVGKIDFFDIHLSKFIGTLALILILFSGGLDTRYSDIRPVLFRGAVLSTLGVLITAIATGLFISYITKMTILEGLLLGSIISSTDAASVFTILRSKNTGLKGKIRPLLELESGSNDPMAYSDDFFHFHYSGRISFRRKNDFDVLQTVLSRHTLWGDNGVSDCQDHQPDTFKLRRYLFRPTHRFCCFYICFQRVYRW